MDRRGFSLFELMLVFGLLGVLWAAIMPAAFRAKEMAESAQCKSNLHQLAASCQNYAMIHGHFPWGMIEPSTHEANYWKDELTRTLYPHEDPRLHGVSRWDIWTSFCWDFRHRGRDGASWESGEMFGGAKVDTVLCCPKCRQAKTDNWDGNRLTGYNYNVCYLGFVENDKAKRNYPTAYESVKFPAKVVVFGDGGYAGGPNKFMRAPFQDKQYDNSAAALRKAGTQAFRHGTGPRRHCNMAFLDGHVQEFREPYMAGGKPGWVDEATYSAFISSGNGIYGPRGWGVEDEDEPRP